MSYILDALRKSERQRREIEEQPLARLVAEPLRKSSRWRLAVVVLAAVTNVAALAYLLAPKLVAERQASAQIPVPQDATPGEPTADQRAAPVADSHPKPTERSVASESSKENMPAPATVATATAKAKPTATSPRKAASIGRPAKEKLQSRSAAAFAERQQTLVESDLAERQDEALDRPVRLSAPRVPEQSLPVDSGESADGLPKPKINVYAYTSHADGERFVIIQDRKYREGDRIDGGAVVRRIEENGMTLEYAGQTYRIPRP